MASGNDNNNDGGRGVEGGIGGGAGRMVKGAAVRVGWWAVVVGGGGWWRRGWRRGGRRGGDTGGGGGGGGGGGSGRAVAAAVAIAIVGRRQRLLKFKIWTDEFREKFQIESNYDKSTTINIVCARPNSPDRDSASCYDLRATKNFGFLVASSRPKISKI